jgi:RNA polymerase sigma-70 factor, ECF subfamily
VIPYRRVSTDTEERVKQLHEMGDTAGALSHAVELYGPEVFGFLVSHLRNDDAARDVFAEACEDLCASIDSFGWRCSIRTWMYKLARSAAARYHRRAVNSAGRRVSLSQVSEVAQQVASRTRDYLRTEVKDRFTALREELDPEDQTLLILRVDRELDWLDVARVVSDGDPGPEELKRAAARLRQRFKTVKDRLRARAIAIGLIAPS